MRLQFRKKTDSSVVSRLKKKVRIRKTVIGTADRPRLCVFRSNQHIYAQLIDDASGKTLLSVSSLKVETKGGRDRAKEVGLAVAKAALDKEIKSVVFDRNGYLYHGRVQSLAEAAREGGLNFLGAM